MSVLIKGMKKPKSCNKCPFSVNGFCVVSPKRANGKAMSERVTTNWCPLTELPPHGDLIDRDALLKTLDGELNWYCERVSSELHFIHEAPTVIEAEQETEE